MNAETFQYHKGAIISQVERSRERDRKRPFNTTKVRLFRPAGHQSAGVSVSFNTTKVRLFHKSLILHLCTKKLAFNTTKVRLFLPESGIPQPTTVTFQYHKGAIISFDYVTFFDDLDNFQYHKGAIISQNAHSTSPDR